MHDFPYEHEHELEATSFEGCCLNCARAISIIKPRILAFHRRIRGYDADALSLLRPEELYQLYMTLDDIAHLEGGEHLATTLLRDEQIGDALEPIHRFYSSFFNLHEGHLAQEILGSDDPWGTLTSFALYPRYERLVATQQEATGLQVGSRLAFLGCGAVPMTSIVLAQAHGIASVGLDMDERAAELARRCVDHLGLASRIEIVHGDQKGLADRQWDTVLVAALAEPKASIFATLGKLIEARGKGEVLCRSYSALRQVLYAPVREEELRPFEVRGRAEPTGRANNTLLLLGLP